MWFSDFLAIYSVYHKKCNTLFLFLKVLTRLLRCFQIIIQEITHTRGNVYVSHVLSLEWQKLNLYRFQFQLSICVQACVSCAKQLMKLFVVFSMPLQIIIWRFWLFWRSTGECVVSNFPFIRFKQCLAEYKCIIGKGCHVSCFCFTLY